MEAGYEATRLGVVLTEADEGLGMWVHRTPLAQKHSNWNHWLFGSQGGDCAGAPWPLLSAEVHTAPTATAVLQVGANTLQILSSNQRHLSAFSAGRTLGQESKTFSTAQ